MNRAKIEFLHLNRRNKRKQRVAGSSPVSLNVGEALFWGLRLFCALKKRTLPCHLSHSPDLSTPAFDEPIGCDRDGVLPPGENPFHHLHLLSRREFYPCLSFAVEIRDDLVVGPDALLHELPGVAVEIDNEFDGILAHERAEFSASAAGGEFKIIRERELLVSD